MLECGIVVGGKNFQDFMVLTICSGELLKEGDITWVIYVDSNFSEAVALDTLEKIKKEFPNFKFKLIPSQNLTSMSKAGFRHGTNLDYLVSKLENEKVMILDQDIVFLKQGWDTYFKQFLKKDVIAVGVESTNIDAWKKTPMIFAVLFDKLKFEELGIFFKKDHKKFDWSSSGYVTITRENKHIWGDKEGTKIYLENGYMMPYLINNSRYKTKVFEGEVKKESSPSEWFYTDTEELLCFHYRMSRTSSIYYLPEFSDFLDVSIIQQIIEGN
tara:strand:+ start:116 stop:928 length:813 start_codon:yes stop_codon:yes gene_type:complete